MLVGHSYGGVVISEAGNAAIDAAERVCSDGIVATVFCDNNLRYLTTDLARSEPPRLGSIVDEIQVEVIRTLHPILERESVSA